MENKRDQWVAWAILFFLILVWGSSFVLIKRSLLYFDSAQLGSLRIIIATLFLVPFVFSRFRQITRKQWFYLFISGLFGNGLPAYFYAIAQHGVDSSIAGILNSLTTLFTLILGLLFFKMKAKWFNVTGVFIGLFGAVGLIVSSGVGDVSFNFYYASFIIMATIGYAINVNVIKTFLGDVKPIEITAFALVSIFIPVNIVLFGFTDFVQTLSDPGIWKGFVYIGTLAVVGSALALILFNRLIQITSSLFAASVTYMIPIVAILWGLADGEIFKPVYLLWVGMILFGVFLVNRKKLQLKRKLRLKQ